MGGRLGRRRKIKVDGENKNTCLREKKIQERKKNFDGRKIIECKEREIHFLTLHK